MDKLTVYGKICVTTLAFTDEISQARNIFRRLFSERHPEQEYSGQ